MVVVDILTKTTIEELIEAKIKSFVMPDYQKIMARVAKLEEELIINESLLKNEKKILKNELDNLEIEIYRKKNELTKLDKKLEGEQK